MKVLLAVKSSLKQTFRKKNEHLEFGCDQPKYVYEVLVEEMEITSMAASRVRNLNQHTD